MRFIIDITHPGHVHLFRHAISEWVRHGHQCIVTARDKDVTRQLLECYNIPYTILGTIRKGRAGHVIELLERNVLLWKLACHVKPHVILGTSVNASHAGLLCGACSVFVGEDDLRATPMYRWIAYPWTTAIVAPDCLAYEKLGRKHLTYPSYQKLFYLHPNRFTLDWNVLSDLGLHENQPYVVVRLSALNAHHDKHAAGLSRDIVGQVIQMLANKLRVFITSENKLDKEYEQYHLAVSPEIIHHVLGCAELLIADSQTMTAEAALLGTPAVRMNSFVGKISYLSDLEKYGLAFGFTPDQTVDMFNKIEELLLMQDRKQHFAQKRQHVLNEKIDPLPWFVRTIELLGSGMHVSKIPRENARNAVPMDTKMNICPQ